MPKFRKIGFSILEIASSLGEIVTSPSELFEDDDGRISKKTGISSINRSSLSALELATQALGNLTTLGDLKSDIGVVIYVTQSPVNYLPNHASLIQDKFGLPQSSICFDINQGCSGYVQGLLTAVTLAKQHNCKALLVCADTYSHHLDRHDRSTQVLFSDGATATIVDHKGDLEILDASHCTDGSGADYLVKPTNSSIPLKMDGAAVFQWTRRVLALQIKTLLEENRTKVANIDAFYIHQASKLVMDNVIKGLGVTQEKVPSSLGLTGNLVSSSIPFLLEKNWEGFCKTKSFVLAGFGVGLSSSCCLVRRL